MGGEWIAGDGAGEEVFDIQRDLLCTADPDGRFTTLNAAWERVLGWTRDELMERPFIDFVHPDDVARTVEVAGRVDHPDYELVDFENRYRTKSGDWRWLRWNARSDGVMWFAVAWDVTERKEAAAALLQALRDERLLAYRQPIVDRAGRVGQHELLARMRTENGSGRVLEPPDFLPAAETSGLITTVDRWMVGQAIDLAAEGRRSDVNLSARSIADANFTLEVEEALIATPGSADKIVFEITETAAIEHFDAAREFAERLGALGCTFALDDFGTGYGSFTYLRRLPVHFIKIDTSFVRELTTSVEDQALVRSIVAIAARLGQQTVAEGVEDQGTLELLRAYGVDHAQGFYIGRPEPLPVAA